jgi:polar amino acid transport system substrate-binding protein
MSRYLGAVVAIALTLGVVGCGGEDEKDLLATIKARGTILVASDPAWPPQSERDADGNWAGFDVSVAEELATRLGVTVEWATPDWDTITAGNWRDQWDISVGSMTITADREMVLHFILPPYYYDASYFFVAGASTLTPADIADGTTICVSSGSTWESWLLATLDLPADQILQSPPTANFSLQVETQEGECQIKVGDGTYDFLINSFAGTFDPVTAGTLKETGDKLFVEKLAVAVDKSTALDSASLRSELATALTAMHGDGTLTMLSTTVYGVDLTSLD